MTKKCIYNLLFSLLLISCSDRVIEQVELIPLPAKMDIKPGVFTVKDDYKATIDINDSYNGGSPEAYSLVVDKDGVVITASTEVGVFYGEQTLKQLTKNGEIPYVEIEDEPRFKYRGLHIDVSRHFFDKAFLLKIIDELAYYKMNRLHLHLTDSPGWRLEIDKYPKLTSETAFRTHQNWTEWNENGGKFVKEGEGGHGGYYTKEDMREIVAYAAENKIIIIPEIEMPGHSQEVLVAYPELSCTEEPYVHHEFCIGNEKTFEFVENVLAEVIEIFPSEYIHIGGDEASKSAWKVCNKCQKRMRDNNLANVDELQSYMIKRVEKYLHTKGRKLLGWDEILEGGLAEDATVMSWRGEAGGIEAVKQGHDVIMAPNVFLYFDYYQANPDTEPKAMGGGYVPLKRVYSYNPIPAEFNEEESKHVLGAQGNVWTEYIADEDYLEYMLFPRLLAVAELTWTPQDRRKWDDFKIRANAHIPQLRSRDINAFILSYDIDPVMTVDTLNKNISILLDTERYPVEVRYTLDGTMPTGTSDVYDGDIVIKGSASLVASVFENGIPKGTPLRKKYDYHKAIGKPVKYLSKLYKGYMASGEDALTDGYKGGLTYHDGYWQGYTNSLECIIDMGEVEKLSSVAARFMEYKGPEIYYPGEFEVLTSLDGVNFTSQGSAKPEYVDGAKDPVFFEYNVNFDSEARFIKIKASEVNGDRFIFIDEIVVW